MTLTLLHTSEVHFAIFGAAPLLVSLVAPVLAPPDLAVRAMLDIAT